MGNRLDGGWAYNEVDQLNAGSGYAYDLKGALAYDPGAATDPRLHFQYGSDDLLRRIDREGSSPQDQSSMIWDADEQRLQLTEEVDYAEWQFLYDSAAGIPAVLFVKHIEDKQDDYLTYYVREPGGELLASFESGSAVRYYHFDALGSTVLLSDGSGNPAGTYAYGAWGDVLASPASWQPYQYVGQLGYYTHTTSQGTELSDWLQLGVRFYQPGIGRFERRDPVERDSAALGVYAASRPLFYVDPAGEMCIVPPTVLCPKRNTEAWPGLLKYGYYCGPNKNPPKDKAGKPKPAFDDVDGCCRQHDEDWASHVEPCTVTNQYRKECLRDTAGLCDCLRRVTCPEWDKECQDYRSKAINFYACPIKGLYDSIVWWAQTKGHISATIDQGICDMYGVKPF